MLIGLRDAKLLLTSCGEQCRRVMDCTAWHLKRRKYIILTVRVGQLLLRSKDDA